MPRHTSRIQVVQLCVVSKAKDHVCRGGNTLLQENTGTDKKAATD